MLTLLLSAQNTANEFLGMLPNLNFEPCNASPEQKDKFLAKLHSVDSLIRSQIESDMAESEEFQTEHEEEARINVLMKLGYSREQAEKLKDADNMSEDELMAIANEMMVNKNNVSLEEYQKVSEYDTAAQGRWAQAQSTIYMADVQIDPEKYQKEQVAIKTDIDLQNEIQFQRDKLRAGEDKFRQQIDTLDKQAVIARIKMEERIEALQKELENCQNDTQRDMIKERMYQLRIEFCNDFTPRYLQIVDQFKAYIIENVDEYSRFEELQTRSLESQTGIKDPDYKPGAYTKGVVGGYISLLADAFKYAPTLMVVFD
jgi:hypothetical protein